MASSNRSLRIVAKFVVVLLSMALALLVVEVVSYVILSVPRPGKVIAEHLYDVERNPDQGYVLKPNNRHHARKYYSGGQVVYDVDYTTDEYGRRTVGQPYLPGRDHLILFGCSHPYGEGLRDEDTLQYMLGTKTAANVYNYGVHGYGPQNMLATLESGRLPDEVSSRKGVAIYYYGVWDVQRATGAFSAFWSYDFPYYRINSAGELERHGSFRTGRPFVTWVYELLNKSNFLRLIHFDSPFSTSSPNVRLTVEIIKKAQREYLRQFHGRFYVLVNSYEKAEDPRLKLLRSSLEESGIPVLYYPLPREHVDDYYIAGDGHPNAKMNELLSDQLAKDLSPVLASHNQ